MAHQQKPLPAPADVFELIPLCDSAVVLRIYTRTHTIDQFAVLEYDESDVGHLIFHNSALTKILFTITTRKHLDHLISIVSVPADPKVPSFLIDSQLVAAAVERYESYRRALTFHARRIENYTRAMSLAPSFSIRDPKELPVNIHPVCQVSLWQTDQLKGYSYKSADEGAQFSCGLTSEEIKDCKDFFWAAEKIGDNTHVIRFSFPKLNKMFWVDWMTGRLYLPSDVSDSWIFMKLTDF